jgi:N-acetylneuraminic acid mutarotase
VASVEGMGRSTAELYDHASGSWSSTGSMSDPRRYHTATLLPDGRVLVAGGFAGSGYAIEKPCSGPREPCSAELYDPSDGRWTPAGKLHADRVGHTATLLPDGTVLVVGLGTRADEHATAELYHPSTGRWTVTASPERVRGFTATLLPDGTVLVTGNFADKSRAAELYVPASRG